VGDGHFPIVDGGAKIVGRRAIAARDDEVVELGIGEFDPALDAVVPCDRAGVRVAKRITGFTPGGGVLPAAFSGRQRPS
jgi:hypothetical protein